MGILLLEVEIVQSFLVRTCLLKCAHAFLFKFPIRLYCLFAEDGDEDEDVHLAPNSADVAPRTIPQQCSTGEVNAGSCRPCGCIVGIIKRNWHS